MGQGVHTVLRQIACEELGLPPERIRVDVDTERELDTGQTTASRATVLGGNAVLDAAREAEGQRWTVSRSRRSPGRSSAASSSSTGRRTNDADEPVTHLAYAWATQVAILDDEGRLAKVVAAHDVGRAINPTLVEGQIEGAVHMGLGQALSEEFVVEGGVPLTTTLKSLHIIPPTGMPEVEVHPGRGAAARGPVRREGRRRGCARADRGGGARARSRPSTASTARELPMKDSPAARAAVPHLVKAQASMIVALARSASRVVDGRPLGRATDGSPSRRAATRHRRSAACLVVPGQRLRPHAPLLGARARDAVRARAAARLPPDPAARLVAARPGARRGHRPRVGARRRHGSAALGDDDACRPPRVAERDRRLARRDRRRARVARRPLGPLLRDERPRRPRACAVPASRRTGAS